MNALDASFLGALALHHARRGDSAKAKAMLAPTRVEDTRTAYVAGLAAIATDAGLSHRRSEPAGRFTLNIDGDLLALPDETLAAIKSASEVHVVVDSPGGDVRAALQILDAAGNRFSKVTIKSASSAAAFLAVLCPGRRIIEPAGTIMLHAPGVCCFGTVDDLRRHADRLATTTEDLVDRLHRRTGQPRERCAEWLSGGDVSFTAEQALAAGLVDSVLR